jgi:AcrR family transcriptional regulator
MSARLKPKKAEQLSETLRSSNSTRNLKRSHEIILAAYQTIAEKGFEGLRMREIAKRAGMNHATLHYYFAGKEALVEGVLDYIVQELSIGRDLSADTKNMSPHRRLAAHFAQLLRQMREQPEMFVVLIEINARSMRDSEVRSVVTKNDRGWKRFLLEILRDGIQKKEFHRGLDPELTASVIIALIRGLYVTCAGRVDDIEPPLRQFSRWLEAK